MKQLVLGGARSGKSMLAQQLAQFHGKPDTYIATAAAGDDEMALRIAAHRKSRPADWSLIEETINLPRVLSGLSGKNNTVLIDCLTLWLSNVLAENRHTAMIPDLVAAVKSFDGNLVMVSNEVGMGIVPLGELNRLFVDEAGRLHQQLAKICDRVILTVAGIPNVIKGEQIEV